MDDKTRSKLLREMYPKSIPRPKQIPSLGELSQESIDVLDALTDGQPTDELGEVTHQAKVIILALQDELKIAQDVILSLKDSLDTAESTFADTCDCGECDACEKAEGYRANVKAAEQALERIKLTRV